MRTPSILATIVVAAVLPVLALAAPVSIPVPVGSGFETVEARGDFDVQVREGSPASVEIVGEPGLAERIRVEVVTGELRLSRKKEFESARGVVVKVVLPLFRGLSIAGSGKGTAESGGSPRDVNLAVSGSGDLAWSGEAGTARVSISGSGDAKLSGKGDALKVAVSGSGEVDAKGFAAKDATVSIAGSGDVGLRLAGGTLTAQIAGSGNVTWGGEGKVGAVATAGSGRVVQR